MIYELSCKLMLKMMSRIKFAEFFDKNTKLHIWVIKFTTQVPRRKPQTAFYDELKLEKL